MEDGRARAGVAPSCACTRRCGDAAGYLPWLGLPPLRTAPTANGQCADVGRADCRRSGATCRVARLATRCYTPDSAGALPCVSVRGPKIIVRGPHVARTARTWKGARTPSALKRARQSLRRRTVNRRTRSEAKTLVLQASDIALGRSDGDGPAAVAAAISALDKAAEKGILHPNNAARRKSRLMAKVNEAHLLDDTAGATAAPKKRTTASKTAQRKKVAAAKASKAAAGKATDRPRTAAGKAKVAVTRASRESAAARRRAKDTPEDES
jgi:small subunit ribosomal protein S20